MHTRQTSNHRGLMSATPWGTRLALFTAALLAGCAGGGFVDRGQLATITPQQSCSALNGQKIAASAIGLPTTGAVITSAKLIPAAPASTTATGVVHALPEYCAVLGSILPVDPTAPPIKFQVNMPTAWNQKTIQVGGGGINGEMPKNLAAIGASGSPISGAFAPDAPYPMAKGYASFGGDSGHQDPGNNAVWALNHEAWINYGHASLKKTHDAAFAVIQSLYGSRPKVSYFMGTSQGGREALEVAQRYPQDYDTVVANVPLIGYSSHVIHKTLLATTQTAGGWIPSTKLAAIGAEVTRQCDMLDGIADGVISNYMACMDRFDPQKVSQPFQAIRCAGGADTGDQCVSDAQIRTLNQMHAPTDFGFELANGWKSFPGYPTGREGLPGYLNINPQPGLPAEPSLGQPGATVKFIILKDPAYNLLHFSIAPFKDKIQAASSILDSTNTDLSKFFARGGRMIVKISGSDYFSNPRIMMQYFDKVSDRFGKAVVDKHIRLYVVPNADHGGAGASTTTGEAIPQYVDLIQMATDWTEKDLNPPEAPVLTSMGKLPPFTVAASKPMCRYPLYPRYTGTGDPKAAASYACEK